MNSWLQEERVERSTVTLEELRSIAREHAKVMLLVFLGTVLGAYLALQFMTERYESKTSLLVKVGRENAEIPATVQNPGLVQMGVRQEEINSEMQLLTSEPMMEAVVDRVGVEAFAFEPSRPHGLVAAGKYYVKKGVRWAKHEGDEALIALNLKKRLTPDERAIVALQDAVKVEPEKTSDVLDITVQFPDPAMCVRIADALVQVYLQRRVEIRRESQVKDFFTAQLTESQRALRELEQQRESIRSHWGVSNADEQRALLLKQLADLQSQIAQNQSETVMLRKQQAIMAGRMTTLADEVTSSEVQTQNPSIQSIKDRITSLELERAKLATRYLDGAEPVLKVENEIADLKALLAKEQAMLPGTVTAEANPVKRTFRQNIEEDDVRIAGLEARNAELQNPVQQIQQQLRDLDVGEDQLRAADREYKVAEANYQEYARSQESARISGALDMQRVANVAVTGPPSMPIEPVYPRKLLIMGIAFPVGLVLAILMALLLEYANETVRQQRDLAGIDGLQVIGEFRQGQEVSRAS
jgi:uncharacterized protein involved in exopolysaccharide biosynthesis